MFGGARGRLITGSFAREVLPTLPGAQAAPPAIRRALAVWAERCDEALGPASSVRAITDVAILPLARILGLDILARRDAGSECSLLLGAGDPCLVVVVTAWTEPLSRLWRRAVVGAVGADARWCLCANGRSLRLVDGRCAWSREHLELDVPLLGREGEAQNLLWCLVRAEALRAHPPLLDRAVELSRRHGAEVCRALGSGVLEALQLLAGAMGARSRHAPRAVFEQSLTVLYRVLFLLFAEARGLLPLWHPVYRDRYSLDAIVTTLLAGRSCRGLWQALRAISRLAHAGCAAGELKVTAFNGRLFAPAQAAAFDAVRIGDGVMRDAVVAVSSIDTRAQRRTRIVYRDLDVEQLGAVYERVLDYEPSTAAGRPVLTRSGDARKSTGTFYTPRAVAACLVRRTLEPLVRDRDSAGILALRVLDPAMGSGAFLVAACRFLAHAAEEALVREGRWHVHDVMPAERAALRREIASRCLFGVDLNPMAVQLARLSLWLATLAGDRPLSFLDHHLVAGDSLVGAAPDDLARVRRPGTGRRRGLEPLPLFEPDALEPALEHAVRVRLQLSAEADDSAAIVRAKERTLEALHARDSPLGRWWRALDLWCAAWFWERGEPPDAGTFGELVTHVLSGRSALPDRVAAPLLAHAGDVAARRRFLHWPIAFPEVFADERGAPRPDPGFDAVIGNPPWDMVRGDSGAGGARAGRRLEAHSLTRFARDSGVYRVDSRAHINRYQLFVERALQLTRPGGRLGLVLPGGAASDPGAGALRRHLFRAAEVDEITGVHNREGIFPIHRSVRFVLITATRIGPCRHKEQGDTGVAARDARAPRDAPDAPAGPIRCRFGITRADDLERAGAPTILLSRALLARVSGEDDLGIPELTCDRDLRLLERLSAAVPRLAAADGWQARFGRELNASDDRAAFAPYTGEQGARAVIEGKQLEPFRVGLSRCRLQLRPDAAVRARLPRRPRLAYRDVASATNRLTLIAAVVPARAFTTHTLFCLKTPLPLAAQHVLCALLNSFVANYLVRLRVTTHVTVALVSRLPVPVVRPHEPLFTRLAAIARTLTESDTPAEDAPEYASLQALVARRYGLDAGDFEHVLSTFPLIPARVREASLAAFLRTNHGDTETRRL